MVRLKHRYLVLNFLYPDLPPSTSATTNPKLPPTLHFNRPTPDTVTLPYLSRLLRDLISDQFGDYGTAHATAGSGGIVVKYLSPATSTAIIRVPRAQARLVAAAVFGLVRFPRPVEKAVVVRVVRVCGTVRKAEEEVIRRAKGAMGRARREGLGISAFGLGSGAHDDRETGGVKGGLKRVLGIEDEDDDESEDDEVMAYG